MNTPENLKIGLHGSRPALLDPHGNPVFLAPRNVVFLHEFERIVNEVFENTPDSNEREYDAGYAEGVRDGENDAESNMRAEIGFHANDLRDAAWKLREHIETKEGDQCFEALLKLIDKLGLLLHPGDMSPEMLEQLLADPVFRPRGGWSERAEEWTDANVTGSWREVFKLREKAILARELELERAEVMALTAELEALRAGTPPEI